MPNLKLLLLGPPQIEQDGKPIELDRRKAMALLAYLAVTGDSQRRETLAALLWPDADQSRARGALRRDLASLNKALAGEWFEADRETIGLKQTPDLWVDIDHFQQLLARVRTHDHPPDEVCSVCLPLLSEAVALYRDDFLAGFTLRDSPEFDEWQFFQTEQLRQALTGALEQLVRGYSLAGDYETAISYARRWLALDLLQESVHRHLMQLYLWAGQRATALRQYQECVRILEAELGAPPEEETTNLYERIRQGIAMPPPKAKGNGQLARARPEPEETTSLVPAQEARPKPTAKPVQAPSPAAEPQDEIRIVTVLYAGLSDVADLSQDFAPEDTATQVGHLFDLVQPILGPYQAQIDRFLGDGAQVVFGMPQIHEDDPERAIQAAMEIQAAAQKQGLAVSIGINTGPVYVGRTGSDVYQQVTVMGPVVNLAARLQAKAEGGQILVGETSYRQTRQAFKLTPLLVQIAGLPEAVTAYEVVGPRRRPRKTRGVEGLYTRLVGRDEELSKLKDALGKLPAGSGQMVSLIGEAGLGKSRLVAELKRIAQQTSSPAEGRLQSSTANLQYPEGTMSSTSDLLWLEGRCLEMNMTASYWPFIDIFRAYFAWHVADNQRERANRIVTTLQEMAAQGLLTPDQVEEIGPLLGHLLYIRFENAWDERLQNADPEQIRYQTFHMIHDFFIALARQRPLVLVFEDLHWADSLSLDLIALLMETLSLAPILLLCVYRPEQGHKSWHLSTIASRKCLDRYTEIRLREFGPQQSDQLIEALLSPNNLSPATKDLILERSQGNPFFLEETILSLIEADLLYQAGETWQARPGIEATVVPESVQSIILSRVDRLEPALKQVLQSAAVIGKLFPQQILGQIIPSAIDLEAALGTLADHTLIYQERTLPEPEYAFRHVLVQEAVYQTIPRRRRAELHHHIAQAIEKRYPDNLERYYERLAYHYDRGEVVEQAILYALKAGQKSRRAYLTDEAVGYFQRAMTRLKEAEPNKWPPTWHIEALTGLGQVHHGLGEEKEAEACFREAIALGREVGLPVRELVRLHFWLGDVLYWQSRFTDMIQIGEEGLSLLGEAEIVSVEAALMNQTIAMGCRLVGDWEQFERFTIQTKQFIQQLPYSEELRPCYAHIVSLYSHHKNVSEALNWLQILEEKATKHHDIRALGEVHSKRGLMLIDQGDLRGAIAQHQRGLDLYTKIGDDKHRSWELGNTGWAYLQLGDLERAETYLADSLETVKGVGADQPTAVIYRELGVLLSCQGAWTEAVDILQKAIQLSREVNDPSGEAMGTLLLGQLYLAQGKTVRAREHFQRAIELIVPGVWLTALSPKVWAWALSKLEATYDQPEAFQAFCHNLRQKYPKARDTLFKQWFLEPAQAETVRKLPRHSAGDTFAETLAPEWTWRDPSGDCAVTVHEGLEIRAANGRNVWSINHTAPGMFRPVFRNFGAQTTCRPGSPEQPATGGLLLWQDSKNFLFLSRGELGPSEVIFGGCLGNEDVMLGRGSLLTGGGRKPPDQISFRLERTGHCFSACCSVNEVDWFTLGQITFPFEDEVEIGLYAVGDINRAIYPGAYPEGTAIRFESFWLWGETTKIARD